MRQRELPRPYLAAQARRRRTKVRQVRLEKRQYALLAVMCTYGIELLADNIAECRANMLKILSDYLNLEESDDLYRAASYVLSQNLVHGDALTMRTSDGQPITFAEWGNTEQMNQALFAFRRYEDASLRYTGIESHEGLSYYGLYDTVVAKD